MNMNNRSSEVLVRKPASTAAVLLAFAVVLQSTIAWGEIIAVQAKPAKGTTFKFGGVQEIEFELTNRSQEPIVVMKLTPLDNQGEEPIALSSSVYGDVEKSADEDAYVYDSMAQQQTRLPFHGGLLFPGERLVLLNSYRPISVSEAFEVDYCVLAMKQAANGLAPDPAVYMRELEDDPVRMSTRLAPFDRGKWQAIAEAHAEIHPLGPDCPPRAVLIPELKNETLREIVRVPFRFEGTPFTLEQAVAAAERIMGNSDPKPALAYSEGLDGYVVFEEQDPWLLTSPTQASRGQALPSFPPLLLKDLDSQTHVVFRVGDKQKGFGPDVEKSTKTFWDRYPVFYGDGMYTQGEFLHIAREEAKDFLLLARQKGTTLGEHAYFFKSRYYTLNEKSSPAPLLATPQSP